MNSACNIVFFLKPRRVAAISLAKRVAAEMEVQLGKQVSVFYCFFITIHLFAKPKKYHLDAYFMLFDLSLVNVVCCGTCRQTDRHHYFISGNIFIYLLFVSMYIYYYCHNLFIINIIFLHCFHLS